MLESLTVRNFALIESLTVEFGPRLNVLSGETGAGKSILVGALGLLLGGKGQVADIRTGADEAEASAVLRPSPPVVVDWLADRELPLGEDGELILRRVLRRSGRSSAFVQGLPVQTNQLAGLAAHLFDLHGQHEHQSLLRPEQHRILLDRYGGLQPAVDGVGAIYRRLVDVRERIGGIAKEDKERLRQAELLRHAIGEIDAAGLVAGEDEELEQERQRLINYEKIFSTAKSVYQQTAEAQGGALASLRSALEGLRQLAGMDEVFARHSEQAESAFYELEDMAEGLRQYQGALAFDADRLQAIGDRLDTIRDLSRKYGDSLQQVLAHAENAREELSALEKARQSLAGLGDEAATLEAQLRERAGELGARRRDVAGELQTHMERELRELGMPKARLEVQVTPRQRDGRPAVTASGGDEVQFLIAPNVGEPLKPLRSVASGGEISRVMLALKSVFAESDVVETLIFDEVDAGIGGAVALQVGQKLQHISRSRQILCITHLATVAARADNHLLVEKRERDARTATSVLGIAEEARISELARMLAGDGEANVSRQHAAALLERSQAALLESNGRRHES